MVDIDATAGPGSALQGQITGYRNVFAVTTGLTILQAGLTALAVTIAFRLRAEGATSVEIGLVASGLAFGLLAGTLSAAREILRIGHIRAYAVFAAFASLATLGFSFGSFILWWAVLQFVIGLCASGLLTAGESWIADSAPDLHRGAVLGFYHVVSKVGIVGGPFLAAAITEGTNAQLMLVAGLFTASLIPVAMTNRAQPGALSSEPYGPRKLWKYAPAAVIAAFMAGAVNNGVGQLYPLFAGELDPDRPTTIAAVFNAAIILGAMTAQWPAGALSDRIDRRFVIALCAFIASLAAVGLVLVGPQADLGQVLALAAIYGAGTYSFYGIAVAHAADRARAGQATSMMAGILLIWGLGSICGPMLGGLAMSLGYGVRGLFLYAAIALGLLVPLMIYRQRQRDPVEEDDKEDYGLVSATSLAFAEYDPRGEESQLDLFIDLPGADPAADGDTSGQAGTAPAA